MNSLRIESFGSVCQINADNRLLDEIKVDKFTKHFIPGANFVDSEPNVTLSQRDIEKPVQIEYPTGHFKDGLSSRDIVTVAEYLLERSRQSNGLYALSSSSASKNSKSVIFWGGATNLGKTSSMIKLVDDYGFEFISDEKTIVSLENHRVIGGSESIPVRKRVIGSLVKGELGQFHQPTQRVRGSTNLSLMIQPHIDDGRKEPIVYLLNSDDFYWHLTREVSQPIRGTTRLVDGFNYQLVSIDTEDLSKKRTSSTRVLCRDVPCFYFQGSLDQISEFVNSKLQ